MKKIKNNISLIFITVFVSVIFPLVISSCGDDKSDEPDGSGNQGNGLVSFEDLARGWTLVKDIVLYSEENPSKSNVVIDYSGNTSPLYRFYDVKKVDESKVSWQEKSSNGSPIGFPVVFTLIDDDLLDSNGNVSGHIEGYNLSHSWNNLSIKWSANSPLNEYGVTCISTYMK